MTKQADWLLDLAAEQRELIKSVDMVLFDMDDVYTPEDQVTTCKNLIREFLRTHPMKR
jgi:hypothetical protein